MKLTWRTGTGPATTQELADEVKAEKYLYRYSIYDLGRRCLWGVIYNSNEDNPAHRLLDAESVTILLSARLMPWHNDNFVGTPAERCAEMVRRLRSIP